MGTVFILAPIVLGILVVIFVRTYADQRIAPHEHLTPIMIAYRRRRLQRFIGEIGFVLLVLLTMGISVLSADPADNQSWDPRCLTVLIGLVVGLYDWYVWRCPQCRVYLGRAFNPHFCSECGAQLR